MCCSKKIKLQVKLALVLAGMLGADLHAADFSFIKSQDNATRLMIAGEIRSGDDSQFLSLIRNDVTEYMKASGISVDSPGGDVNAAIRLAQVIEESGLGLRVESGDVCASACFLLYVSAPLRIARPGSQVIVHRPYYDMTKVYGSTQSQSAAAYQDANLLMRNYLLARGVSNNLIDKMMQMPSSRGYVLTIDDLVSLDLMSAPVQEYAIQNCGYSSANSPGSIECIKDYLRASRYAFIANHIHLHDDSAKINFSHTAEEFHVWLKNKESNDPDFKVKVDIVTENVAFGPGMNLEQRIEAFQRYYESL